MIKYAPATLSRSEQAGIGLIPDGARSILSVGISTGGVAEIAMAELHEQAHVTATTVDVAGSKFAGERIRAAGLSDRVAVKVEDVAKPLPYKSGQFDYVYARLVLHYLDKRNLPLALKELRRVLRKQGTIFVVVRSARCPDANVRKIAYDPDTCLTTYVAASDEYKTEQRQFHTEESIISYLTEAGFKVHNVSSYDEQLFADFMRTVQSPHIDNLIEAVATKS